MANSTCLSDQKTVLVESRANTNFGKKYALAMREIIEPLPSSEALYGAVSKGSVVLLPAGESSKVFIQERRNCWVTNQLVRQLDDTMALVLEPNIRDRT